jgi:hypothetical protein
VTGEACTAAKLKGHSSKAGVPSLACGPLLGPGHHPSPLLPSSSGVALLANAPERVVERRRRPRDSPTLSNSVIRATSRAKHRLGVLPHEEQPASQRVSARRTDTGSPRRPGLTCGPPQDRLSQVLRDLEDESTPIVKLGDASIAAPFTSKLSSIQCSESRPAPLRAAPHATPRRPLPPAAPPTRPLAMQSAT